MNSKSTLWAENLSPITLVFGSEEFLANRYFRDFKHLLASQVENYEIHEVEANEYSSGLLNSLASPSLFAEPRLILIRAAERCTDEFIVDCLEYLANPEDGVYLIIRHNGSSVRGKKLLDELRQLGHEVLAQPITKDSDRAQFVIAEFKRMEKQISQGAVRALQDAFSDDLAELAAACEQLAQDAAENITEELVDSYFGGRVETNAFKVIDAALAGKAGEALGLLRHALATGVDPVPLVAAFSMKIRQLAKLYGNRSASPQSLGMAPWQLDCARKDLAGWDESGLVKVISHLVLADAAAKGSSRDPEYVLENLIRLIAEKGTAAV